MIITNILLAVLVALHFKKLSEKNKGIDIFTTKSSYELLPLLQDIELLKNNLDAHKVSTEKSISDIKLKIGL